MNWSELSNIISFYILLFPFWNLFFFIVCAIDFIQYNQTLILLLWYLWFSCICQSFSTWKYFLSLYAFSCMRTDEKLVNLSSVWFCYVSYWNCLSLAKLYLSKGWNIEQHSLSLSKLKIQSNHEMADYSMMELVLLTISFLWEGLNTKDNCSWQLFIMITI